MFHNVTFSSWHHSLSSPLSTSLLHGTEPRRPRSQWRVVRGRPSWQQPRSCTSGRPRRISWTSSTRVALTSRIIETEFDGRGVDNAVAKGGWNGGPSQHQAINSVDASRSHQSWDDQVGSDDIGAPAIKVSKSQSGSTVEPLARQTQTAAGQHFELPQQSSMAKMKFNVRDQTKKNLTKTKAPSADATTLLFSSPAYASDSVESLASSS